MKLFCCVLIIFVTAVLAPSSACFAQQPKPADALSAAQSRASDRKLRRLLAKHVKGLAIDEKKVRIPIPRPPLPAFSDPGTGQCLFHLPAHGNPGGEVAHHLDVNAFGAALQNALKDNVVGYSARLRQHGQTIFTQNWQWAKLREDTEEVWTPDVQLHVASVSKLITAMAMTELMMEKNISPERPDHRLSARLLGEGPQHSIHYFPKSLQPHQRPHHAQRRP